jgi:hypothetical protein
MSDVQNPMPSIDMFRANPIGGSVSQSVSPELNDSIEKLKSTDAHYGNGISTQRNVVTANEMQGVCERSNKGYFTGAPSQRHRIVLARSQEQQFRNGNRRQPRNQMYNVQNHLNSTRRKNQTNLNDSLMSSTTAVDNTKQFNQTTELG